MKRWLAKITIATYLTALFLGVACHAMNVGLSTHPITYFFVWDMFCGWSAHEIRYHLIGETENGIYYHLSPAPWNTFAPYGDMERGQYDTMGNALAKIALNTLKHTEHEPVVRMFVIEEMWPKKYNLPDHLWALRFDEPKDPHSYFWLKTVMDGNGTVLQYNRDIITNLQELAVSDNPRLKADSQRGKPFITISPSYRNDSARFGAGAEIGDGGAAISSGLSPMRSSEFSAAGATNNHSRPNAN